MTRPGTPERAAYLTRVRDITLAETGRPYIPLSEYATREDVEPHADPCQGKCCRPRLGSVEAAAMRDTRA